MSNKLVSALLAAWGLVNTPDIGKPPAQRGRVQIKPHSRKIWHIIGSASKTAHNSRQFQGQSAYKQYKPVHAGGRH